MDITQLAEISLEGSASLLLIVIAIKILRAKLDIKSSCLGNALQLESHNPGYRPEIIHLDTYRRAPVQIRIQRSFEAFVRSPPQSHPHPRVAHA